MWIILGFDVGDIAEDTPDDLEGLDFSAAHVANLLSTEPADGMFLFQLSRTNICQTMLCEMKLVLQTSYMSKTISSACILEYLNAL